MTRPESRGQSDGSHGPHPNGNKPHGKWVRTALEVECRERKVGDGAQMSDKRKSRAHPRDRGFICHSRCATRVGSGPLEGT